MKQLVSKEKPGGTNPKMNNPLSNGDLQLKYQFIVNLTRVNKLSFESHRLFSYRSVLEHEPLVHNSKITLEGFFQHRPLVYDSKTTFEGLDLAHLMIGLKQLQIYQFRLYVDWFSVVTLKGKGTKSFRYQKRNSKVFPKLVLGFLLYI